MTADDPLAVEGHDLRYAGKPTVIDGLRTPSRVSGDHLELAFGDRFERRFWPGVNLGSTTPGFSPGELSPTADDYARWFKEMTRLGVRVVRIYTIQKPVFYDTLRAFNLANQSHPLYVIHGVWIPEEAFLEKRNAFDHEVTEPFMQELENANGAVHGAVTIDSQPGHASGEYRSDISPWVLAWAIGVEWDPAATDATNIANAGIPPHRGRFVSSTDDANPMETWMATMLDHAAALDHNRGWTRPVTFTNWVTTDPLRHPEEPIRNEDLVSIDAMHMRAESAWPGGFFASYHVYPYYPDFLGLQPSYASYHRPQDDKVDAYAGYLNELKRHHRDQAVMITEFGVPSSLGIGHYGPHGRNQGGHSERDAMLHIGEMMSDISAENYAGAIVFEWVDEWFKFTWNTFELELPQDRRQLWRNPLTNEEHFGLLAAEPGAQPAVVLDGNADEWSSNGSVLLATDAQGLSQLRVTHDEEYLYVLVDAERTGGWRDRTLAFDVRPGGNGGIAPRPGGPVHSGLLPKADIQVDLLADGRVRLLQAAWTDPFAHMYGVARGYVPFERDALRQGSGAWVPLRQMQSRPFTIPSTGEQRPTQSTAIEILPRGVTDRSRPDFDDRSLAMDGDATIELRLPWSFLTFSDPSSHQVIVPHDDGTVTSERVGRLGIALAGAPGDVVETGGYEWSDWNAVQWHEQRKAGWDELAGAFARASR